MSSIYGPETGDTVFPDLMSILDVYRGKIPQPHRRGWSQRDAILITYPDQVQQPGLPPLKSLGQFCADHLADTVSGIHILPFFPWSSDDGFSVMDYETVAPQYGTWTDVSLLGERFHLMFDAVINHASAESSWFQRFLEDAPEFREYFIEVKGDPDLSAVVRPRALPLLTEFESASGKRKIWTTFSADQVDLNYHNPRVLRRALDVLLYYVSQGAEFIRLDAIAYLWKEVGTSCVSLPETHRLVKLMRAVLDEVAPHVMLVTETNVPNLENLSYFGDGSDEAQLVYNFPLPPLVLHALQTGQASTLSQWAATLQLPSRNVAFLNFLASHDGIGLNPLRGILPESEILAMAQRAQAAGGFISNKTNPNGTESPYEVNANYFDALDAGTSALEMQRKIDRFITAHAILLGFAGVPAIYFHSMFGSCGWPESVRETGKYRAINRQKLSRIELETQLSDPLSFRGRIFRRLSHLLKVRADQPCFSPDVPQRIIPSPPEVLLLLRERGDTGSGLLCVHNVGREPQQLVLNLAGSALESAQSLHDLISGRQFNGNRPIRLQLEPYQSLWLSS